MTNIRRAVPSDASFISKCVEGAYKHYISRIGKPPGPMLEDYEKVIKSDSVYVIEVENKIAGVVVLIQSSTGILLDNVAVHTDYQGKGLGKRLIEYGEAEAINRRFEKIDLYTHECMTENIELYRKNGYVETERKEVNGYHRVYMQKQLVYE